MNKAIFLIVIFLGFNYSFAQTVVQPNIEEVTVFYVGAEITHDIKIELKPGLNKVVLNNVSSEILARTVQLSDNDIILINSKIEKRYSMEEISNFVKSKEIYTNQLTALNKKVTELGDIVSSAALAGILDYYETKSTNVHKKLFQIEKMIKQAEEVNTTLKNDKTANLHLLVSNSTNVSKNIKLKYLTGGAGWAPAYKVFAKSAKQSIELNYIVKVMNQTGEDWNDVAIKMSSAFPLDPPQKLPTIQPWYISSGRNAGEPNVASVSQTKSDLKLLEGVEYIMTNVPIKISKIEVPNKQSVPANGAVYSFSVFTKTLPASLVYHSIPSMDPSPFVIAQVTNWKGLSLLDGMAKVDFNGTIIGSTLIEIAEANDTLQIILGKDDGVYVSRTPIGNKTFKKEKNNSIKETLAFDYTIKNNLSFDVELHVFDQVPVSQTSEVKVNSLVLNGGKHNLENGEIEWTYNLTPGQSVKNKEFSFLMDYPTRYASSVSHFYASRGKSYKRRTRAKF